MFVRAFDKSSQAYFKSMVYAILDSGWYARCIVFNPQRKVFQLIRCLDYDPDKPLIEKILTDRNGWCEYDAAQMQKYQDFRNADMALYCMSGYPEVYENFAFLSSLLTNGEVPLSPDTPQPLPLPAEEGWHYIHTQEDAHAFMKLFAGFHDAEPKKLVYVEGEVSTATLTVDNSLWYGIVECCFEGVRAINLRPPMENEMTAIIDATLIVHHESIFWADGWMEAIDFSYDGCFIHALSMKWRKIG